MPSRTCPPRRSVREAGAWPRPPAGKAQAGLRAANGQNVRRPCCTRRPLHGCGSLLLCRCAGTRAPPPIANGSHPERLRLGEGGISSLRRLEHGRNPRLLAGRQAANEGLLDAAASIFTVAKLLQQFLVHCDIVELAKRILKLL